MENILELTEPPDDWAKEEKVMQINKKADNKYFKRKWYINNLIKPKNEIMYLTFTHIQKIHKQPFFKYKNDRKY
jgi:hypothetical protein